MESQGGAFSKIRDRLPNNLQFTLDSLLTRFSGEDKVEIVQRLDYYTTSRPNIVGSEYTEILYNAFFDLLSSHPKYALQFLRHSEGYYRGVSIETELAAYELLGNSVRLFDRVNPNILGHFITTTVRPIKTEVGEVQERKERAYQTVAILEENLDWLNSLEQELAGELVLQIGTVYAMVIDDRKAKRLVLFYRNIEPLLRKIIHNKPAMDEDFRRDIHTAINYSYETLEHRCQLFEKIALEQK